MDVSAGCVGLLCMCVVLGQNTGRDVCGWVLCGGVRVVGGLGVGGGLGVEGGWWCVRCV